MEAARRTTKGKLDALIATVQKTWANPVTLVKLSSDFKQKLKTGYKNNSGWKCVKSIITSNANLKANAAKLSY